MNYSCINILILGSSGFIGSYLVYALSKLGQYRVFSLDRDNIDLVSSNSPEKLYEFIQTNNITIVVVCAAVKRQDGDSKELMIFNNSITQNICDSLSRFDKSLQVVYISSLAVFGEKNNQLNYTENSPLCPTSFYGEHKVYSELVYARLDDLHAVSVLRPPLIYHHNASHGYHPGGFYASAVQNQIINLWGDGSEVREFVHIYDFVSILLELFQISFSGQLNICAGCSYSYHSLVSFISNYLDFQCVSRTRSNPIVNHTYNNKKLIDLFRQLKFISPFDAIKMRHFHHHG